jgi:hypothetical protein
MAVLTIGRQAVIKVVCAMMQLETVVYGFFLRNRL